MTDTAAPLFPFPQVRFDDQPQNRTVWMPCEGGDHGVRVTGSKVEVIHDHDLDLVEVVTTFGGTQPVCMRVAVWVKAHPFNRLHPPMELSRAEGWKRKVVCFAAAAVTGLDEEDTADTAGALFVLNAEDTEIPLWAATGIRDTDIIREWRQAFTPTETAQWIAAGVTDPAIAVGWAAVGVTDPVEAHQRTEVTFGLMDGRVMSDGPHWWAMAGVTTTEDVDRWVNAGIRGRQAASWRAAGFIDPDDARQWGKVVDAPRVAAAWRAAGFDPDTARAAMKLGASSPEHAAKLRHQNIVA